MDRSRFLSVAGISFLFPSIFLEAYAKEAKAIHPTDGKDFRAMGAIESNDRILSWAKLSSVKSVFLVNYEGAYDVGSKNTMSRSIVKRFILKEIISKNDPCEYWLVRNDPEDMKAFAEKYFLKRGVLDDKIDGKISNNSVKESTQLDLKKASSFYRNNPSLSSLLFAIPSDEDLDLYIMLEEYRYLSERLLNDKSQKMISSLQTSSNPFLHYLPSIATRGLENIAESTFNYGVVSKGFGVNIRFPRFSKDRNEDIKAAYRAFLSNISSSIPKDSSKKAISGLSVEYIKGKIEDFSTDIRKEVEIEVYRH